MKTLSPKTISLALPFFLISGTCHGGSDWMTSTERLGAFKPATLLFGKPVRDRHERRLGLLQDLFLDLETGRVLAILVSSETGAALVPPTCYARSLKNDSAIMLSVDRKLFQTAPTATTRQEGVTGPLLEQTYLHFGEVLTNPIPVTPASAAVLSQMTLLDSRDRRLGQVKDLTVDLATGRMGYLILEPADEPAPNRLYPIPPVLVRFEVSRPAAILQADGSALLAGPHFQKEFSTDLAFPKLAVDIRRHYGLDQVAPGLTPSLADGSKLAALPDGGPGRSDHEITQAVLSEMVQGVRTLARMQFAVSTVNGRVTLSGIVKNDRQRMQLVAAAQRVVGMEMVEDRLTLAGKSRPGR